MADFKKVPTGEYTCFLSILRNGVTKTGKPKVSFAYKVCDGDYKGNFIWDNCTCANETGCSIAAKKINILTSGNAVATADVINAIVGNNAAFESYAQNIKTLVGAKKFHVSVSVTDDGFDRVYIKKEN